MRFPTNFGGNIWFPIRYNRRWPKEIRYILSRAQKGDSRHCVKATACAFGTARSGTGMGSPVVWEEQLIVADAWGLVRSLRVDTGGENWSFKRTGGGRCVLVQAGSLLYVSAADGWLYALESDGREQWRVRTGKGRGTRRRSARRQGVYAFE